MDVLVSHCFASDSNFLISKKGVYQAGRELGTEVYHKELAYAVGEVG